MKEIKFSESVPVEYRGKIERQVLEATKRFGFNDFEIDVDEHNVRNVDGYMSALAKIHHLPQITIQNAEDGKIEAKLYDIDKVDDKVIGYFFGHVKSEINNPRLSKAIDFSVGDFLTDKVLKIKNENHRSAKAWIYSISSTGGLSAALFSSFGEISPLYSFIGTPVLYDGLTHIARDVLAKREARKAGYKISYFE